MRTNLQHRTVTGVMERIVSQNVFHRQHMIYRNYPTLEEVFHIGTWMFGDVCIFLVPGSGEQHVTHWFQHFIDRSLSDFSRSWLAWMRFGWRKQWEAKKILQNWRFSIFWLWRFFFSAMIFFPQPGTTGSGLFNDLIAVASRLVLTPRN